MNGIAAWIEAHSVGFGTSFFAVMQPSGGEFAQWSTEALTPIRRVPGGNVTYAQTMGRGPKRVSYPLVFATVDSYANFELLIGTIDTLTLPADVAAITDRVPVVLAGVAYDQLPDTLLVSVDAVKYHNGGITRCEATFLRAVSDAAIAEPFA